MEECRFGIHDLSRTQLDRRSRLPRFNMPLELGMFLAAKRFGVELQRRKNALILDRDRYRYQKFISDIAGQDIRAHDLGQAAAISVTRRLAAVLFQQGDAGRKRNSSPISPVHRAVAGTMSGAAAEIRGIDIQ